ncbi:hypothetical protein [Aquibacillus saliphilus]|nr:hypothetical protein [Aquibacillus saliphilus]
MIVKEKKETFISVMKVLLIVEREEKDVHQRYEGPFECEREEKRRS